MAEDDNKVIEKDDGSAVVTLADTSAAAEAFRDGLPDTAVAPPGTTPPPKAEKAPKVAPETEETVEDLRQQIEATKAAKAESDRRAAEAAAQVQATQREVQNHRSQAEQANFEAVTTALDSAKSQLGTLKKAYAQALRDGDHDAAAEAQADLAMLAPRIAQLDDAKAEMEAARKAPPAAQPPRTAAAADPFEAHLAQMSPNSAAWCRAHPDYLKDRRLYAKLLSAHHDAEGEGITLDTPEYFSHIEGRLGLREAESQGRVANAPVAPQRERTMAAPVSRTPAGAPRNAREVTLTPAQREAAAISGISEIEYARQLIAGQN